MSGERNKSLCASSQSNTLPASGSLLLESAVFGRRFSGGAAAQVSLFSSAVVYAGRGMEGVFEVCMMAGFAVGAGGSE